MLKLRDFKTSIKTDGQESENDKLFQTPLEPSMLDKDKLKGKFYLQANYTSWQIDLYDTIDTSLLLTNKKLD